MVGNNLWKSFSKKGLRLPTLLKAVNTNGPEEPQSVHLAMSLLEDVCCRNILFVSASHRHKHRNHLNFGPYWMDGSLFQNSQSKLVLRCRKNHFEPRQILKNIGQADPVDKTQYQNIKSTNMSTAIPPIAKLKVINSPSPRPYENKWLGCAELKSWLRSL